MIEYFSRGRSAINVIAKKYLDRAAIRTACEVNVAPGKHLIEQIGPSVHISHRVDSHPRRQPRRGTGGLRGQTSPHSMILRVGTDMLQRSVYSRGGTKPPLHGSACRAPPWGFLCLFILENRAWSREGLFKIQECGKQIRSAGGW